MKKFFLMIFVSLSWNMYALYQIQDPELRYPNGKRITYGTCPTYCSVHDSYRLRQLLESEKVRASSKNSSKFNMSFFISLMQRAS